MKEQQILSVITSIIGDKYIGDDCAYLRDLGIVVTQDSLIENIHFDMKYTNPYQLGYKSAMVNISDIAASGGIPKYITVGLSLPKSIEIKFVENFYKGLSDALDGIEIIGGDITSSDKIMISITAIGMADGRKISSRTGAKEGYAIVVSGVHGSSAGGLKLLSKGVFTPKNLIDAHLLPKAQVKLAGEIAENMQVDYGMMDSSDGLADALLKLADSSNQTLVIDFDKIPFDKNLKDLFPNDYIDMIFYGGEDYQLVAAIPKVLAKNISGLTIIGTVEKREEDVSVIVNIDDKQMFLNSEKCFNHFKE
ncbi:MAG: thiamine-phosphate kinase [Candidatus Gastranaerophilales bacterium]|nr:thiamine-phosphate kinase [Candidatus Gastranaerophilales bacterium]